MRKWICLGVIGGLLEFGIVYQVAFSEVDGPAPEALAAAGSKNQAKISRSTGRAVTLPDHSSGKDSAADQVEPTTSPAGPPAGTIVAPPAVAASQPAAEPPAQETAVDPKAPSLASVLAAASSVTAKVAAIPLEPVAFADPAAAGPAGGEGIPPAQAPPSPVPAEPVPVPKEVELARMPVEDMIREVFGPAGEKAVQVARCESTLRPNAKSGQFLGLFQMGANERADYGHGADPLTQIRAAHALFLKRGWQPWTCA